MRIRRLKKKPVPKQMPFQRDAIALKERIERTKEDLPFDEFLDFARMFDLLHDSMVPADSAIHILRNVSSEVRSFGYDNKFHVTLSYQEGKYPNAEPQIICKTSGTSLWKAVATCYLSLCARAGKNILQTTQEDTPHDREIQNASDSGVGKGHKPSKRSPARAKTRRVSVRKG